jgi:Carboxypeptidase regulatory-like domain
MRCPTRRAVLAALAAALASAAPAAAQKKGASVRGTVRDRAGRPAVSVWVIVSGSGRDWKFLTGNDGRYFIGYIAPGRYRIEARKGGDAVYSDTVTLRGNEVRDIRLARD